MVRSCQCVGKQVISGSNANGPYRFTVGHFVADDERVEGKSVFSSVIPPELANSLVVGDFCDVSLHYELPTKPTKRPVVDYIAL